MMSLENMKLLWILTFSCVAARPINGALLDWFWSGEQDVYKNGRQDVQTPLISVPFETKTEDEKFLQEALKFTDIMKSSPLDVCQHNVVLKIKTSCSSMTEEELAKMSVNLLNCQSEVDDRATFPCTEDMSLKQCTVSMDASTWNAYHMMNNRARAVCLASRRAQFQALSEMTVNKLLSTAQDQVTRMSKLLEGQDELEALTIETMGAVREGNINIMLQQQTLKNTQQAIQSSVVQNLRELSREKSLIAAGNRELENIKRKLDETNSELALQSLERLGHHQQVLTDIETIQRKADAIFQRIDESTSKLLAHHRVASEQYEETLRNLQKINATVSYLTQLFASTHSQLEDRIEWIKSFLGESGDELSKLTSAVLHVAYLLMGMLLASFLQLPLVVRAALTLILPLNLLLVYDRRTDLALDFPQITVILVFITITNALVNAILSYVAPPKAKYFIKDKVPTANGGAQRVPTANGIKPKTLLRSVSETAMSYLSVGFEKLKSALTPPSAVFPESPGVNDSFVSSTERDDSQRTPTPTRTPYSPQDHNLVSRWLETSKFPNRPHTPASSAASIRSGSPKNQCSSRCVSGARCRNACVRGRDTCSRHLNGSSIIG